MSVFVMWTDYDGGHLEEFENKERAEVFVEVLTNKEAKDENGTRILGIVEGKALKAKPVEVIKRIKLEDDTTSF